MQTIDFLKKKNFSDKFIELFFTPFFAGIFLEKDLQTSSKFFKYVFSNFSKGLACLPSEGMQKIPDLIFKNISSDRLLLNQSLEKIEDKCLLIFDNGQTIKCKNVVLTGGSHKKVGLNEVLYNSVKNIYFESDIKIENGKYIHLFPKDNIINNIRLPNLIKERELVKAELLCNNDISSKNLILRFQNLNNEINKIQNKKID